MFTTTQIIYRETTPYKQSTNIFSTYKKQVFDLVSSYISMSYRNYLQSYEHFLNHIVTDTSYEYLISIIFFSNAMQRSFFVYLLLENIFRQMIKSFSEKS